MSIDEHITSMLQQLSEENIQKVRDYVAFLQWREQQAATRGVWKFDFVEHFAEAERGAERETAGIEIKTADATCGSETRVALWEHPPLVGAAFIRYAVPIPSGVRALKLSFAIGIRDGAELPPDRYVAFRVAVNGWKLWSAVKNSQAWDEYEVAMPELSSDVARIEFITDGLGDHRWNWAVWGEPKLIADL
jgi:hypothetical protein